MTVKKPEKSFPIAYWHFVKWSLIVFFWLSPYLILATPSSPPAASRTDCALVFLLLLPDCYSISSHFACIFKWHPFPGFALGPLFPLLYVSLLPWGVYTIPKSIFWTWLLLKLDACVFNCIQMISPMKHDFFEYHRWDIDSSAFLTRLTSFLPGFSMSVNMLWMTPQAINIGLFTDSSLCLHPPGKSNSESCVVYLLTICWYTVSSYSSLLLL